MNDFDTNFFSIKQVGKCLTCFGKNFNKKILNFTIKSYL